MEKHGLQRSRVFCHKDLDMTSKSKDGLMKDEKARYQGAKHFFMGSHELKIPILPQTCPLNCLLVAELFFRLTFLFLQTLW